MELTFFWIEKYQPFIVEPYIRISDWEGFCAYEKRAVAICNNYVALVKLYMPIPRTGVEYNLVRGYHGLRWNLNASAFQKGALHGYLRLRWLLPTSICPVTICNNYVAVVKLICQYLVMVCYMILYECYMVSGGIVKQQSFNIVQYIGISVSDSYFPHQYVLLPFAITMWQ